MMGDVGASFGELDRTEMSGNVCFDCMDSELLLLSTSWKDRSYSESFRWFTADGLVKNYICFLYLKLLLALFNTPHQQK